MRAALFLGCLLLTTCKPTEAKFARASVIASLDQAIGGPSASARVGDFLLENDQLRAVIEQGESSRLPLDLGGSLVDLDLQRSDALFRGGRGLDQLGQIAPTANLAIARAMGPKTVRLSTKEGAAEVTVAAEAVPIQKVLTALGLLLKQEFIAPGFDHGQFRLYTEYFVRPGERLLRERTTVGFDVPFCRPLPTDGCNQGCDDILYDSDCQCPRVPDRCGGGAGLRRVEASPLPDRPEPMGLSDVLLGDLPRPVGSRACTQDSACNVGEVCAELTTPLGGVSRVCRPSSGFSAGVFMGDMLLFGGQLSIFLPGSGYDADSDIRALFDSGQDTLSQPLKLDAVYALGDRVSYGYASPTGKVLAPIFGGPFSMGATAAAACRQDTPGCLSRVLLGSERWVSVGEGDASSAAAPLALARGVALGEVNGAIRWVDSGRAISGAEVYAVTDPRALACDAACRERCGELSEVTDAEMNGWAAEAVLEANRCRTLSPSAPRGSAGVVSMARSDPGTTARREGRFRLQLPPERYVLIAVVDRRVLSAPRAVTVTTSQPANVSFALLEPGLLRFSLVDERGEPTPGRLTVGRCFPGASCHVDSDCGEAQQCQAGACACPRRRLTPLELGGARRPDGVLATVQTPNGEGSISLPAGDYQLVFSHGPQSTVDRRSVTLTSGLTTQVQARVARAVDRSGYAGADFHVHAEPSIDSGLAREDRVTSFLAEDMDFLSSSDHDVLTSYESLIVGLGQRSRLSSHVGVETTTQELGHFIGFPLQHQEWSEGTRVLGNGAPDWRGLSPQKIFEALRAARVPGADVVVNVPHPYSYFDSYGVDPKCQEPVASAVALFNPLVESRNFSGDFDSMELLNGKAFDLVRRPTVGEVRAYSSGLDALLARRAAGTLSAEDYDREAYQLSTEVTRRMLHRTVAEQDAARKGEGAQVECRCGSDGDCSPGKVCDAVRLKCVLPAERMIGAAPPDTALCRSLRGVIDDWFGMLNRGVRRSGVSGSDVHGLNDEAGIPRTLLPVGPTLPVALTSAQVTKQVLSASAVVSNGPMLRLTAEGAGPGATVSVSEGAAVSLSLRVETAGWYDVDRLEVYRNGELIHWMSGCGSAREEPDPHGHPCLAPETVVAFEDSFDDAPPVDAWYVAIVTGLDRRSLAPVYSSTALARLGTFEVTQRIYDLIPALSSLRIPRFPTLYPTFPIAITNPVYVDLGGDGWKAPMDAPSWCVPGRDSACPSRAAPCVPSP